MCSSCSSYTCDTGLCFLCLVLITHYSVLRSRSLGDGCFALSKKADRLVLVCHPVSYDLTQHAGDVPMTHLPVSPHPHMEQTQNYPVRHSLFITKSQKLFPFTDNRLKGQASRVKTKLKRRLCDPEWKHCRSLTGIGGGWGTKPGHPAADL